MIYKTYLFWLLIISLVVFTLERIFPWREQKTFREQFFQDGFWLLFNGYLSKFMLFGIIPVLPFIYSNISSLFKTVSGLSLSSINIFSNYPLYQQLIIYLIISDFIEWLVHNLLHRVGFLWKIHRVHHSIKIMDWLGNFRFHWGETIIYSTFKYLPLALLGVHWSVILTGAVIATAIGHINHSNINISWGSFRYILNSPRMHIWHHEKKHRGKAGVNFGIVFSIWDWFFRTAYMPIDIIEPKEIGFKNEKSVPVSLIFRFLIPFYDRKNQ